MAMAACVANVARQDCSSGAIVVRRQGIEREDADDLVADRNGEPKVRENAPFAVKLGHGVPRVPCAVRTENGRPRLYDEPGQAAVQREREFPRRRPAEGPEPEHTLLPVHEQQLHVRDLGDHRRAVDDPSK